MLCRISIYKLKLDAYQMIGQKKENEHRILLSYTYAKYNLIGTVRMRIHRNKTTN